MLNLVVLIGTVAADPVERNLPDGDSAMEYRIQAANEGKRTLPLPATASRKALGREYAAAKKVRKGDTVALDGRLERRFYRSGAGARSLTEVVVAHITTVGASEEA